MSDDCAVRHECPIKDTCSKHRRSYNCPKSMQRTSDYSRGWNDSKERILAIVKKHRLEGEPEISLNFWKRDIFDRLLAEIEGKE